MEDARVRPALRLHRAIAGIDRIHAVHGESVFEDAWPDWCCGGSRPKPFLVLRERHFGTELSNGRHFGRLGGLIAEGDPFVRQDFRRLLGDGERRQGGEQQEVTQYAA